MEAFQSGQHSWQAALFDEGWLVPENPPGLGGQSASETELLVYLEEIALLRLHTILALPRIWNRGADTQKVRFLGTACVGCARR